MKIQVGDILKWHKSNSINGIAIVIREYNYQFDVCWLVAKGFEVDREASTGYTQNWITVSDGWRKLT